MTVRRLVTILSAAAAMSTATAGLAQTTMEWMVLSFQPAPGMTRGKLATAKAPVIVGTTKDTSNVAHTVRCSPAEGAKPPVCTAKSATAAPIAISDPMTQRILARLPAQ